MPETYGGYKRISDDPYDLRAGIERQEEDIRAEVVRQGSAAERIVWYSENDTSAFKKKRITVSDPLGNVYDAWRVIRPVWHQALHDLRTRKITTLVVWDLDRLARDPRDLEDAIEAVERYGARIVSATASAVDLATEGGQMQARMMIIMANKSSADTARRVKRWHAGVAKTGAPVGGRRPFGFEADRVTHNAREAELVRRAAQEVIDGVSLHEIARRWEAEGVPTVLGGPWRHTSVRQILRNPRLAGWRTYKGEVMTDDAGGPLSGTWDPILDEDTFVRVRTVLAPSESGPIARRGARHQLLSGIVRCGRCTGKMYAQAIKNGRFNYACRGRTDLPHVVSVAGKPVDEMITDLLLKRLRRVALERPAASFEREGELVQIRSQITELMGEFSSRRLTGSVVFPQVQRLERERDLLQAEKDRFLAATAGPEVRPMSLEEWKGLDLDVRRAIAERNLEAVLVKPASGKGGGFDMERIDPVWRPSQADGTSSRQ
ncbi:recombinase family protein [Antribacter gilvus]|uniref:recombinase family protein n=1 Tax=Antribacter gilvus TaxID=2304675 RepID=UPI0013E0AA77|nr:recombinase family protein [Antribacter gilvus]